MQHRAKTSPPPYFTDQLCLGLWATVFFPLHTGLCIALVKHLISLHRTTFSQKFLALSPSLFLSFSFSFFGKFQSSFPGNNKSVLICLGYFMHFLASLVSSKSTNSDNYLYVTWRRCFLHESYCQQTLGWTLFLRLNCSSALASVLQFSKSSFVSWYILRDAGNVSRSQSDVSGFVFTDLLYRYFYHQLLMFSWSTASFCHSEDIPNGCAGNGKCLCNDFDWFSISLSFNIACFSPEESSLVMLVQLFLTEMHCARAKHKAFFLFCKKNGCLCSFPSIVVVVKWSLTGPSFCIQPNSIACACS